MAQGGADCAASALLARQLAMRTAGTSISAPPQCVDSKAMWPQARTAKLAALRCQRPACAPRKHSAVTQVAAGARALMYWMVLDTFGFTTFSSAFTRRFVVLIAASSVRKLLCRLASWMSSSIVFAYEALHLPSC